MSELYRDFIEDQFDRVVNAINNELPTPTQADIGKVVQVASDGGSGAEYVLDDVPNELPTPTTADIGKFATVVSDGSGGAEYSLDNVVVPQELPTPTTADIGKFATVVSDGSGGAEYSLDSVPNPLPTPTTSDIGKALTVVSDGGTGAEFTIGNVVSIYNPGAPSVSIQIVGGVLNSVNIFLGTRTDVYNIFSTWGKIAPVTVQVQGFTSNWAYRYNCLASFCSIDYSEEYVIFKGIGTMNDTNKTVYDFIVMIHKTDSTKDKAIERAI